MAGQDNRLARKLNEAKKLDVFSGGYTEALSPGKGSGVDGLVAASTFDGSNNDEGDGDNLPTHDDGVLNEITGSLTSSALEKYEHSKDLIAVSYLASVERSRQRGRLELKRILDEAALRIQCMWRSAKAKGQVEDILLKLQAAAVLQGIVRRDQSKAIFERKKEEKRVMLNQEMKARKAGIER